MAGDGVPGQRDHRVLRPAAMPAFRRVPPRASGGIQYQATPLDRPRCRERGARRRGHPPLPVRGPALPGTRHPRRAAGCPHQHPRRRAWPVPRPRRPADRRSRWPGDRYPGGTLPVYPQQPPALLRCCLRHPRAAKPGRPPTRTTTMIGQDSPSALQRPAGYEISGSGDQLRARPPAPQPGRPGDIAAAGRLGWQLCWPEPWTGFSARTVRHQRPPGRCSRRPGNQDGGRGTWR